MAENALGDVKVIELATDVAGPYCAKMLADYGADVIKIEEPGIGDISRTRGPFPGDNPDPEKSGIFLYFNTNKKGITLNLKTAAGAKIFKELIRDADILVESFHPGTMANMGLGYEILEKINPKLIVTSITNFGQTGPYKDYQATDLTQYALSAFSYLSGVYHREPLQHVLNQAQIMAARHANVAIMTALYYQRETGLGQYIDVSIVESVASQPPFHVYRYAYTGGIEKRGRGRATLDGAYLKCKDGRWITFSITGGTPFSEFANLLGIPELADEKYADVGRRNTEYDEEIRKLVEPKVREWDSYELFHKGCKTGFALGIVQDSPDILACPQLNGRDFFQEVEHPKAGKLKYPRGAMAMNVTPGQIVSAAPLLGEHNEEIYCRHLGYKKDYLRKLREQGVI